MSNCSVKLKIHEHIEVLGSTFILNRYIYVCVYMYVCMYVCIYVYTYVCIYIEYIFYIQDDQNIK